MTNQVKDGRCLWLDASYGGLGAPLAMAALPLFVQLPAYYAGHLGVALAPLGWILFAARLLDMLQDPVLGHLLGRSGQVRKQWMAVAGLLLACTFAGLWRPPAALVSPGTQAQLLLWLAVMLVLAYGAHSLITIAYLSWGARLPDGGLRSVAWREGAGLAGVIVASVIPPQLLASDAASLPDHLTVYCLTFAALLFLCLALLLRQEAPQLSPAQAHSWRASFLDLWRNRALQRLLPAYWLNALAMAIPASLALFFIDDQLQAAPMAGWFLASYFAAGACGLPLWTALARRLGARRCWRLAMLPAILGFIGAALLGPGDQAAYFAVCIATGATLGADLLLPPILLGQVLEQDNDVGSAFGLFTMLGKLALAVAGLALALLSWLDYQPGSGPGTPLLLIYAVLPCLLKMLAFLSLGRVQAVLKD